MSVQNCHSHDRIGKVKVSGSHSKYLKALCRLHNIIINDSDLELCHVLLFATSTIDNISPQLNIVSANCRIRDGITPASLHITTQYRDNLPLASSGLVGFEVSMPSDLRDKSPNRGMDTLTVPASSGTVMLRRIAVLAVM